MIKNNIINFFKYLTVIIFLSCTLYRFRFKISYNIFENPLITSYFIFIILMIINIYMFIILLFTYKEYNYSIKKKSLFYQIGNTINTWVSSSYKKVIDYIADIPGFFSTFLAFMTLYYIKISPKFFKVINYMSKIYLIIALSYDVFFINTFKYSYIFIYLLFITILLKAILYISIEVNTRILDECTSSISIKNYDNVSENVEKNLKVNYDDFFLTKNNKQFLSVKQVIDIGNTTSYELNKLNIIENNFKEPLIFQIILRLGYIIIFGYIVYKYPLSIFNIF